MTPVIQLESPVFTSDGLRDEEPIDFWRSPEEPRSAAKTNGGIY